MSSPFSKPHVYSPFDPVDKYDQDALLTIARDHPEITLGQIRHLKMPRHHDVRAQDVDLGRLGAVLAVAYDRDLHSFGDFLLTENLGPRTL